MLKTTALFGINKTWLLILLFTYASGSLATSVEYTFDSRHAQARLTWNHLGLDHTIHINRPHFGRTIYLPMVKDDVHIQIAGKAQEATLFKKAMSARN
ncbi:MAG: hypothetical protein ACK5HY_06200 [Parahaliea sp.]